MLRPTKELNPLIAAKHEEVLKFIESKTDPATKAYNMNADDNKIIEDRTAELNTLVSEREESAKIEQIAEASTKAMKDFRAPNRTVPFSGDGNGQMGDKPPANSTKSIGQMFVDSDAYKAFRQAGQSTDMAPIMATLDGLDVKAWIYTGNEMDPSVKTTLSTAAGWAPFIPRGPQLIPIGQIMPVIADLIPSDNTDVPGAKYMEETTYTNNADVVAEGASKPEAALAYTERTVSMSKIAVTLPVTDEQLEDVPQIRGVIDNRLSLMVRQKEQTKILSATSGGDGFDGFLIKSGVQTAAQGTDPIPTAVLKQMAAVQYSPGFAMVTGLVMNPIDWLAYVDYQTTIGNYVVGSPTADPIMRMWGLPIVVTNALTQGTLLLGDFRTYAQILRRQDLRIDVGYANDDFLKNLQRIRAEERMTLIIYRASAFATVTSIH